MIHPAVSDPFGAGAAPAVPLIPAGAGALAELAGLHMEANGRVIGAMRQAAGVNLADPAEGGRWARGFLAGYDRSIRELRQMSDRAFALLGALGPGTGGGADPVRRAFRGTDVPLMGSIIFSYRELWFLARALTEPGFAHGSVAGYEAWAARNSAAIAGLQESLGRVRAAAGGGGA